jgi:hypothetical protein
MAAECRRLALPLVAAAARPEPVPRALRLQLVAADPQAELEISEGLVAA